MIKGSAAISYWLKWLNAIPIKAAYWSRDTKGQEEMFASSVA